MSMNKKPFLSEESREILRAYFPNFTIWSAIGYAAIFVFGTYLLISMWKHDKGLKEHGVVTKAVVYEVYFAHRGKRSVRFYFDVRGQEYRGSLRFHNPEVQAGDTISIIYDSTNLNSRRINHYEVIRPHSP